MDGSSKTIRAQNLIEFEPCHISTACRLRTGIHVFGILPLDSASRHNDPSKDAYPRRTLLSTFHDTIPKPDRKMMRVLVQNRPPFPRRFLSQVRFPPAKIMFIANFTLCMLYFNHALTFSIDLELWIRLYL